MGNILNRNLISAARWTSAFRLEPLWLPFYALALFVIKKALERPHIWVSARNSYTSGALVPPLSDLDITIIYDDAKVAEEFLKKRIRSLKRAIPLFKEANVYSVRGMKPLVHLINPYELQRDRALMGHLEQCSLPFPTPNDDERGKALAFLLRALEADLRLLLHYPDLRRKRWKNLASILNRPSSMEDPLEEAIQLAGEIACGEIDTALFKEFATGGLSFQEKFETFWPLFPVRYLLYCLEQKSSIVSPVNKALTPLERDILEAHIEWEIWGLFGQALFEDSPDAYMNHLNNLRVLCMKHFDESGRSRIDRACAQFRHAISCHH